MGVYQTGKKTIVQHFYRILVVSANVSGSCELETIFFFFWRF